MKHAAIPLTMLLAAFSFTAKAESVTLRNPTKMARRDELVRLPFEVHPRARAGAYRVMTQGKEIPCQLGTADGKRWLWTLASLEPGARAEYVVEEARPTAKRSGVSVKREGSAYILDSGILAVRVPAVAEGGTVPAPILAVRVAGKWVGAGRWHTNRKLKSFAATVLGNGPVFAKVRLRYEFEGKAGLNGNVPAFAEVDVLVAPGQKHVVVQESHEMGRGDEWGFDCAAGWDARKADVVTHSRLRHAHGGAEATPPSTLEPGQTRMGDTLVNLQARWSQAFDEGWFFACHNGTNAVGALVVRPMRWHWPHNNMIAVKVKESGDYAGLHCPTWKGRRFWFLLAGPASTWADKAKKQYAFRHAFQSLDKLNHEYILDWPGLDRLTKKPGGFQGMDLYSSGMNPTSGLRGLGRRAIGEAGKQGNLSTLTHAQVLLDPDVYGSYWNYWSPENPNFFTDFVRPGIAYVAGLKKHPRFRELARLAEQRFREDMYHTITLPGGAGQECPGYVAYAMSHTWKLLAPICKQHLGFDPTTWPRYKAGISFLLHVSQPIGGGQRRCHPGGDTHPLGPDVFALADEFGVRQDVGKFVTEELPGFGVVFRNRPNTERETYLAFKSGPNRGHYHGDQLSFHYCAAARPLAIDHMCSYGPRAGQEHMHNRVAFHTDKLPYANMDGYERVIALKTSRDVDVAMGQVESERLRVTTEYPPEEWDTYLPEQRFDTPLLYRRTIVCLKNRGEDYFVIRDQHAGPKVNATWCLHMLSKGCERKDSTVAFDRLTVFCATPETFSFGRHDWLFEKKDRKSGNVVLREDTRGVRLTTSGDKGEFITVLYPGTKPPKMAAVPGGVRVGDDVVTFAGGIDDEDGTTYVRVERGGKALMTVTGRDVDLDRSQGEVGLFVPDAGYPFGVIPDWLIRQRSTVPEWAPDWATKTRARNRGQP